MRSVSKILGKGKVDVPDSVLKALHVREGDEIVWSLDLQEDRVYIKKKKSATLSEIHKAEVQSAIRSLLLSILKTGPRTFNELHRMLKVSTRTLAKELKECQKQQLVKHAGRNKPYLLTKRGHELLRISMLKPVEGNDLIIETVWKGPFLGSIILRLPSHLGKQFAGKLYTPKNIDDLNRIMLLALEFWVNKHSQTSPCVQFASLGRDFNGDGVEDLMICEAPRGYPHVRKTLKENKMPMPLWEYALQAAEEKLSRQP